MANDIYKVVVEWSAPNGSISQNVHYLDIAGGDVAVVADLVADLVTSFTNKLDDWLPHVSTAWSLLRIVVYQFDALTGVSTPYGTGAINSPGTGTGKTTPEGVAVKINLFAAGRPRPSGSYLPAPDTNSLDSDGTLGTAALTAAAQVGVNISAGFGLTTTGLTGEPVRYSAKDLAVFSVQGATVQVDQVCDYQRRRKAGVGS